jgi:hypothetical protein
MSEPSTVRAESAARFAGRRPGRQARARAAGRVASALQAALAVTLASLALLAGLEIHPAGEAHEPLAGLSGRPGQVYFEGASHPVQPPHAESARMALRPYCALCIERLQSAGARPAAAARLATPLTGRLLTAAPQLAPVQRSLRPAGARAPPPA